MERQDSIASLKLSPWEPWCVQKCIEEDEKMISYVMGNIFDAEAQTIVNPVNIEGVMGKGLALEFKKRYPQMFLKYNHACKNGMFEIGRLMIYRAEDHTVLLFPTKEKWRNVSHFDYIEKGLQKFVDTYEEKGITSIAFPCLGCGAGGLNWSEVKPVMEKYLEDLPIPIYVYLTEQREIERGVDVNERIRRTR
jgi:O-acetyl-ADP-ribose deacetylase (regulator of RNase III)